MTIMPMDLLALIIIVGTCCVIIIWLTRIWFEVISDYRIHAINFLEMLAVSLILIFVIILIAGGTFGWITQLSQTYNWW